MLPFSPIIITGIVIICILIGALFGLMKGLKKATVRLITVVGAALIAGIISTPIAKILVNKRIVSDIMEYLQISDIYHELISASPAIDELSIALLIAFLLLFVITIIPYTIANMTMNIEKPENFKERILGAPVGAVQGLVAALIPVIILAGYLSVTDRVVDIMLSDTSGVMSGAEADLKYVDGIIEEFREDPFVRMFCGRGTPHEQNSAFENDGSLSVSRTSSKNKNTNNFLFESISKINFRNRKISLTNECVIISQSFVDIAPIVTSGNSTYTKDEIYHIEDIVQNLGESRIIMEVGADIISGGSQKWLNGEPFLGYAFVGIDENIDPIIIELFKILKDTTSETLKDDIKFALELVNVFDRHELLIFYDDSSFIENINGEFISELLDLLSQNERFNIIIPEVTNLGIKILATTLNLPETSQDVYNEIMADISVALNATLADGITDENLERLSNEIYDSLRNGGIDVPEDVCDVVSHAMSELFAEQGGNISSDLVKQYFEDYALVHDVIEKGNVSSSAEGYYDLSNNISYAEKLDILNRIGVLEHYDKNERLSEAKEYDIVYNNMTADDFTDYIISVYNKVNQDISGSNGAKDSILTLASPESMNSHKITTESLLLESGECELSEEDINNISTGLDNILGFVDSVEASGGEITLDNLDSFDISSVGQALDLFKDTSLLGETVDPLAGAIIGNITGSSSDVSAALKDGNVSYESLMDTVQTTAAVISNIQSNTASDYDKTESMITLLECITPENADVVVSVVDKNFMVQQGSDPLYAEERSNALKVALEEMAQLDPVDHNAEAEKIRYIFEMCTDDSPEIYGENGIFSSADELISMGTESKVVSAVLKDVTVDENGNSVTDALGFASKISADDKVKIEEAINDYYYEKSLTESTDNLTALSESLISIAALFALNININ